MSLEPPLRGAPATPVAAGERGLSYAQAVNEAIAVAMERDPGVFVIGQNVTDETGVFGTCLGLAERFGVERVIEAPLAETATAGFVTGAAMRGMRPVLVLNRPDFLYLMMDQFLNHAAKWHYMFGGQVAVPLTVWAPVARGWGTGAQHTQAMHGFFVHAPGVKVVTPSIAADAKGLLLSAIFDDNPTFVFDHRWAMRRGGHVPEGFHTVPFGAGQVRREGTAVSLITFSHGVSVCLDAAEQLAGEGMSAEVVDLRSLKPFDEELLRRSVAKTRRAIVVDDSAWSFAGMAAELAAWISEHLWGALAGPVLRVTCPDAPAPSTNVLEDVYYPRSADVVRAARSLLAR
jgi:pyruvate/2-oxoglutarate/acetoin dehydrogenase E1 component